MAAITPNSDLYLLKCPLEIDNTHQLNFANKNAQANYFLGLPKKLNIEDDTYTYIRHDSVIRVNAHIDTLLEYNYVMYRNDAYSNKWFYAFITDMEYLNDGCTAVTIKGDSWQNWQFDITFKRSFVEREHVNNDTFGIHTVPEDIQTGEYICNKMSSFEYTSRDYMICMQVTELPNDYDASSVTHKYYNRIINGCWVLGFPYNNTGVDRLNSVTRWYDANTKADAIVAMFIAPKAVISWNEVSVPLSGGDYVSINFPVDSNSATLMQRSVFENINTLDGYSPKNAKCYCYPYNFLTMSNNNGEVYTYNFEDFDGSASGGTNIYPTFEAYGTLSQGCSIKAIPINYKKGSTNIVSQWDCGVNGGKFPIVSWTSDYYLNWQAQNREYLVTSAGLDIASNIVGTLGAKALNPLDLVGSALNAFSTINEAVHQDKVAQAVPNQAKGNTATGDLNFSFGVDRFTFKQMCCRNEFIRIVDDYFSAFGYKVITYKVPNITGRANWNFVKLSEANIIGDIPQQDMDEIKGYFLKGITIWHNPNTFLDYTQNNNIV